jgi:branched-chain amino acid transport system substrate-binding protein
MPSWHIALPAAGLTRGATEERVVPSKQAGRLMSWLRTNPCMTTARELSDQPDRSHIEHALKGAIGTGVLALLLGCGDRQPLRIAVVGSAGAPLGAVLAVEDINAAGGINGTLLELGVVDEPRGVLAQHAIATAESLAADDRILAVIGHGGSTTSLAASTVYNARHVPQIAPDASSPLFSHAGPYSFRLVASDEHQAGFIVDRIRGMTPVPRVAVLYVNDEYGRAFNGFLHGLLPGASIPVVHEAPFLGGESFARNLDDVVRSVAHAKPDLLVWVGLPPELSLLRPRLRQLLPRMRVLGSDGVSFIGSFGDLRPFEGDWVVSFADMTVDRPDVKSLVARFRPLSGREFTGGAALTFDAAGLVAQAMRSGAVSREAIREYLETFAASGKAYEGITGPIVFDASGDALPSYALFEVTAGGLRRLRP